MEREPVALPYTFPFGIDFQKSLLRLLVEDDSEKADALAKELDRKNIDRQKLCKSINKAARAQALEGPVAFAL